MIVKALTVTSVIMARDVILTSKISSFKSAILEGRAFNIVFGESILWSQILEYPSIGEYWNISGVPVLPEKAIFTFFRKC